MSKVRHSASAENDLLEAWLFIAEDSVETADRLLDQIQADFRVGWPHAATSSAAAHAVSTVSGRT